MSADEGQSNKALQAELEDLRARLADAEESLRAISAGEVDALVASVSGEPQVFVLQSSDVASNRFHSEILAKVSDAVVAFDEDHHITYLNTAAEEQYAVDASDVLGRHVSSIYRNITPGQNQNGWIRAALDSGPSWQGESEHLRQDGTTLHVESSVNRLMDDEGEPAGFLHVIRDISRRRESEAAFRESEERYRTLFNSIDEGFAIIEMIFGTDGTASDYRFLHVNPSFEAHTGMRDVVGKTMREKFPNHEEQWFGIYGQVARTGEPARFELQATELGRWFDVFASRMGGEDKHQVVLVFNDVTDRRTLENTLRAQAEDLAATDRRKDEFLAMLSHELRNPLAPILPAAEILLNSPGDPELVAKIGRMMKRQVDQMSHLIDDLLDVSRITTGKIELRKALVPLAEVVDRAVESVQPLIERFRHELSIEAIPRTLMIEADPHRLAQVVSNLLSNAAKYTPAGGKITLTTRKLEHSRLRISVKDNGKGIKAENQSQIFDLFDQGTSGAKDGLGIGLTLVRSLVGMHDGTVAVASDGEGKGSEFTVELPGLQSLPGAEMAPVASSSPKAPGRKLRVLIADDGKSTADVLAMFFTMEGLEAVVAYNGEEAVAEATRFGPDLVCLDLGMPVIDGYEAARLIRSTSPDTYLVALSGWGSEDDRRRTGEAGFNEHLTKPVKPDDLRELVRRAFPG